MAREDDQVCSNEESPRQFPFVSFELPKGWKAEFRPLKVSFTKGKLSGEMTVGDEDWFDWRRRQSDEVSIPGVDGKWERFDVVFGDVFGLKFVYRQTRPSPWKRVDYYLTVPGGFVAVYIDGHGPELDELPFEKKAHTLRVVY